MQTAYSIYEDSKDSRYGKIIVRLNQGKNTDESRDLIKTKTQEGLDSYQVVGKPPFVVRDATGKSNILINVVEMDKIEHIKFKMGNIGFVLKGEVDLSQLVSQFDLKQTKGGSRKYNKSSKTKKYKTTKNKKNKKSTKHKKTKKNKKTRR